VSELPTGQVTIGDLYRELVGMRGDLARSLSKLEVMEARHGDAERQQADHEGRLRTMEASIPTGLEGRVMALEKFRFQLLGALIVVQGLGVVIEWLLWSRK
jgi:hypothetical protein